MKSNPRIPRAVLMRLAGRSLRDIAADLDVTPESVRQYLHKAREGGYGLNVTITDSRGVEMPDAARALRAYLDSLGLRRIESE